ncbi:MAG TPA: hypothetical protein VGG75_42670 [Trebonia sp.]
MGAIWNLIFGGGASDITKLSEVVAAIWDNISDAAMWESLAWILLGGGLMIIGLVIWLKIPQIAAHVAGDVARAAVAAA